MTANLDFDYIDPFELGHSLTRIRKNDLWGLVDEHNQIVLDCSYRQIGGILGKFVPVKQEKWGIVTVYGAEILPCIYDRVSITNLENPFEIEVESAGVKQTINLENL